MLDQTSRVIRDQLCLHADAQFFGFKPNTKASYMQLYEESQFMDCSKAMLALASIYEKGIADETQAAVMMGALQRRTVQENSSKAFEYYDRAAEQD